MWSNPTFNKSSRKFIAVAISIVTLAIPTGCQEIGGSSVEPMTQIEFLESPSSSFPSTIWTIHVKKGEFSDLRNTLKDESHAPWWGNEELAQKFMVQYLSDYYVGFYVGKEGLSNNLEAGALFFGQGSPRLEDSPVIAYEESGKVIKAFALHEPSTVLTGNMVPRLAFPVIPVEISKTETEQYIIVDTD